MSFPLYVNRVTIPHAAQVAVISMIPFHSNELGETLKAN